MGVYVLGDPHLRGNVCCERRCVIKILKSSVSALSLFTDLTLSNTTFYKALLDVNIFLLNGTFLKTSGDRLRSMVRKRCQSIVKIIS